MGKENIFDKFGQAINEAYIDSAEFRRQLSLNENILRTMFMEEAKVGA